MQISTRFTNYKLKALSENSYSELCEEEYIPMGCISKLKEDIFFALHFTFLHTIHGNQSKILSKERFIRIPPMCLENSFLASGLAVKIKTDRKKLISNYHLMCNIKNSIRVINTSTSEKIYILG